jgi:hypothetical protein
MTDRPTPFQLKALRLARPSGHLRRLPGGYWVGDETKWRDRDQNVPPDQWVGTTTVRACDARGWLELSKFKARLTDLGWTLL